jgi:hypothetical protein
VDFSLAQLLQVIILLGTGGQTDGGYLVSKYVVIAMHFGILFLHALINSVSIHWLSYLGTIAAGWNILGEPFPNSFEFGFEFCGPYFAWMFSLVFEEICAAEGTSVDI